MSCEAIDFPARFSSSTEPSMYCNYVVLFNMYCALSNIEIGVFYSLFLVLNSTFLVFPKGDTRFVIDKSIADIRKSFVALFLNFFDISDWCIKQELSA